MVVSGKLKCNQVAFYDIAWYFIFVYNIWQYFALIILIFLSEFLIGAMIFLFRAGMTKTVINELRSGIEKHYNATDKGTFGAPSVATIWDSLQNDVSS